MEAAAVYEVPPPHTTATSINHPSTTAADHLSPSSAIIAKGKRTKRHRTHSPIPFTLTTPPPPSSVSSDESTTTDDIDTAHCLILLSRGPSPKTVHGGSTSVYTCKTCGRSFPSFQALGGHRASHKKPKNIEKKFIRSFYDEEDFPSPPSMTSPAAARNRISPISSLSLQLSNNASTTAFSLQKSSPSPRVHECSYCGAEFTSGQALGGHMRKHRGGPAGRAQNIVGPEEEPEPEEPKRPVNNGFSLDLNLPAPDDEKEKSPREPNRRFGPSSMRHYYSTH